MSQPTVTVAPTLKFTPALKTIQFRAQLIREVRERLTQGFGADLPQLRGNVELIREILIAVRSMHYSPSDDAAEMTLFMDIYKSVFGSIQASDIEYKMLTGIVEHLRSSGQVYRRTRFGNFVRGVLRLFRA